MNKKTILITGASRGIGKASALYFGARGYHVFLNCRKSLADLTQVKSEIDQMTGGSCDIVPGDVGNPEDVRKIFQHITATSGGIDILVNNAGVAYMGLLSDMSDSDWDQVLQTNLSSAFYCCREAIPHMVSLKSGRIINVSSMWGTIGASCEAAYSAAKSGIHGLTRALAKELAPSNIQVNALACGVIDTAMNDVLDDTEKAALSAEIPAGRFGTAEEAAQLIWDIAHAPTYMTGQIIGIDGGF